MIHVVTGHICSGKSTYVRSKAKRGDVVIDFDRIALAIAPEDTPHHDYPEAIRTLATFVRQAAIDDAIAMSKRGRVANVWIIHAYPTDQDVMKYRRHGATIVEVECDAETLTRRAADQRPLAAQLELKKRLSAPSRKPLPAAPDRWTQARTVPRSRA